MEPIEEYGAPATEFNESFVVGMRKRMATSFHKYGLVSHSVGKVKYVESARQRIDLYLETGNTEWLIDAANYVMMEYMNPQHTNAHYRPTDSGESPGRIVKANNPKGEMVTARPNLDIRSAS